MGKRFCADVCRAESREGGEGTKKILSLSHSLTFSLSPTAPGRNFLGFFESRVSLVLFAKGERQRMRSQTAIELIAQIQPVQLSENMFTLQHRVKLLNSPLDLTVENFIAVFTNEVRLCFCIHKFTALRVGISRGFSKVAFLAYGKFWDVGNAAPPFFFVEIFMVANSRDKKNPALLVKGREFGGGRFRFIGS